MMPYVFQMSFSSLFNFLSSHEITFYDSILSEKDKKSRINFHLFPLSICQRITNRGVLFSNTNIIHVPTPCKFLHLSL